ncbi:MAG TPA: hypothetical protein VFG83_01005 [Kofleriaceae bacterium]|nr:hypothetical protein [Kofleriaceae bacterium]
MAQSQAGDIDGDKVDLSADPLGPTSSSSGDAPLGADENPAPPTKAVGQQQPPTKVTATAKHEAEGYPQAVVLRPLTLLGGMVEAGIEVPISFDPSLLSGVVHARYGITSDIQVGVDYGLGFASDPASASGKAVAVEARYRLFDFAALQLAVPVAWDPFGIAITAGIPVKFVIADKLALVGGQNLLTVRLGDYQPSVDPVFEDPDQNAIAADRLATNTEIGDGEIRVFGGLTYQASEEFAVGGDIAIRAVDFTLEDAAIPLLLRATYSPEAFVDIGARIGMRRLDEASDSFTLSVFATARM